MKPLFAALALLCLAVLAVLPTPARADQEWLLISDIHLNPFDGSRVPSPYGTDTNWTLWQQALAAMRHADPNPAVVVVSGDFLAHHFGALSSAHGIQAEDAATRAMQRIAQSLNQAFPRAQFVIALGNNDDPCGDYRTAARAPYLAALARIWAPLVNRRRTAPEFVRDFSDAGYYTARLPDDGLRAVVLDDIAWSVLFQRCGRDGANMAAIQAAWLAATLRATPAGERNVAIMHVPPGVDVGATLLAHGFAVIPFLSATGDRALDDAFGAERSRIAFAIAGHTHRPDFRVTSGVPMIVAGSISPIYQNNPSFLILRLSSGGRLRDATLYADDLLRAHWAKIFDFDRAYRIRSFGSAALNSAHERIGSTFVARARWANARMGGSPNGELTPSNWRVAWCAQTTDDGSFSSCAGLRARLLVLPAAAALLFVIVVASVALIVLRLGGWRRR